MLCTIIPLFTAAFRFCFYNKTVLCAVALAFTEAAAAAVFVGLSKFYLVTHVGQN